MVHMSDLTCKGYCEIVLTDSKALSYKIVPVLCLRRRFCGKKKNEAYSSQFDILNVLVTLRYRRGPDFRRTVVVAHS